MKNIVSMSVTVHPAMGLPQNGIVGEKLAQQVIPLSFVSSELETFKGDDSPVLSYGQHMQYMKQEDFAVAKTDCERVPGDASTTFSAFMVHIFAKPFQNIFSKSIIVTFVKQHELWLWQLPPISCNHWFAEPKTLYSLADF